MKIGPEAPTEDLTAFEAVLRAQHSDRNYAKTATLAIERYGPELLGFLMNLLRNQEEACEVFGQASLDIWTGIMDFRWNSNFRTWAYTITRNAYLRYRKQERKWNYEQLEKIYSLSKLVAEIRTRTKPYLRTEIKSKIQELRRQLTPDEQAILTLRLDREMSWREVAEVMLSTPDMFDEAAIERMSRSCRKRFERIKNRLRDLAEEAGLLDSDD